ncbi:DUF1217 domain-containing protein [Pararhodobacter aggregans]|uniref:Flagellar protein n=1 Tax=Pararhodobacter aggregans TaxID=404875 RepID=A0A2T7ULH8_9RHOB|nr:DUF1217 domain-containing protein [Pararhodobacter aggregans]PTW99849.1 uncharacterized protein DUF1217 [Pararhodobacter aggregans]PVE45550.1 flagellar protein [Pararhodobacter aggregans]
MSFQPILPLDGYVGWRFLQRTLDKQQAAANAAPQLQRDEAHFREKIASITSAEDLVKDRQLLSVALTAFGLQDDLPNRAYIQKVLESPAKEEGSFINRLADRRYKQLNAAFGFGDTYVSWNQIDETFADRMVAAYRDQSFEVAVGAQNESMRLALGLQRDLADLARQDSSELTRWYTVLGTGSLRAVFETAFMLPTGFGALDLDRQVEILQGRMEQLTGSDTISQFKDPEAVDTLIRRYFLAGQVKAIQDNAVAGSGALTLLQNGQASLRSILGR